MAEIGQGPSEGDSGRTHGQKPQLVFMAKGDMAGDPKVLEEFDVVFVEGPMPRWMKRKLRKMAKRGRHVTVIRL